MGGPNISVNDNVVTITNAAGLFQQWKIVYWPERGNMQKITMKIDDVEKKLYGGVPYTPEELQNGLKPEREIQDDLPKDFKTLILTFKYSKINGDGAEIKPKMRVDGPNVTSGNLFANIYADNAENGASEFSLQLKGAVGFDYQL